MFVSRIDAARARVPGSAARMAAAQTDEQRHYVVECLDHALTLAGVLPLRDYPTPIGPEWVTMPPAPRTSGRSIKTTRRGKLKRKPMLDEFATAD